MNARAGLDLIGPKRLHADQVFIVSIPSIVWANRPVDLGGVQP